jgi:hypothetical protein
VSQASSSQTLGAHLLLQQVLGACPPPEERISRTKVIAYVVDPERFFLDPDPALQIDPDPDLYIFTYMYFLSFLSVQNKDFTLLKCIIVVWSCFSSFSFIF